MWIALLLALVSAYFSATDSFTPYVAAALCVICIWACEYRTLLRDRYSIKKTFKSAWQDTLALTGSFISILWAFEPMWQKLVFLILCTAAGYGLAYWLYNTGKEETRELRHAAQVDNKA